MALLLLMDSVTSPIKRVASYVHNAFGRPEFVIGTIRSKSITPRTV